MLHYNSGGRAEKEARLIGEQFASGGSATLDAPQEAAIWKILVMDGVGQRIISPVLKVNDLREHGVTLYLYNQLDHHYRLNVFCRQLHGNRAVIDEVPGVYFVEPTAENIARIIKDVGQGLYESFYINFTSTIPRTLLEELAAGAAERENAALIAQIYDQYLNFITLEDNLFSLDMPEIFVTLNDARSPESQIDSALNDMASGLLALLLTLGGQPPLIYARKSGAAESVAERLDTRIRNYLANARSSTLGDDGEDGIGLEDSLQRPLLLVLDRSFDLAGPLRHASIYNALVHDILGMKLNRVNLGSEEAPQSPGSTSQKTFDIDGKDVFWRQNCQLPFPTVAENVDLALNQYKNDMQQVTRTSGLTATSQLPNMEDLTELSSTMTAEELRVAINVLPELTERKRMIDTHLQISTALLDQIKARDLGDLFYLEQQIINEPNSPATRTKVLEALRGRAASMEDKLRLFLVYFLTLEEMNRGDWTLFEGILREAGITDLSSLEYAKRCKSINRMSSLPTGSTSPSAMMMATSTSPKAKTTAGELLSLGGRLTGGVLGNVLNTVKNLLPDSAETPLTKFIDSALDLAMGTSGGLRSAAGGGGSSPRDEQQFAVFDPKLSRDQRARPTTQQRSAFNHLIVFVIGGSNYAEYNHAVEFVEKKSTTSRMTITFGSTDLLSGEQYLLQLARLGKSL